MAKKEAKAKKENSKNKKKFLKDFKAELKRVSWPTPKQLLNNTTAVITIVLITAVIVFALDLVFETLNKYGVEKIKEIIVTDNTTAENTTNEATNNTEQENETTQEVQPEENTPQENPEASKANNLIEEQQTNTENQAEQ